jgi:hypothetical protein
MADLSAVGRWAARIVLPFHTQGFYGVEVTVASTAAHTLALARVVLDGFLGCSRPLAAVLWQWH